MTDLPGETTDGQSRANDVSLYHEIHGQGQPLVLIAGLGYASWLWWKQVPLLARHAQVITFDNRGVGQSDKPDVPYSIPLYASDVVQPARRPAHRARQPVRRLDGRLHRPGVCPHLS